MHINKYKIYLVPEDTIYLMKKNNDIEFEIKKLSKIKNSDIEATKKAGKKLILSFDKNISLTHLALVFNNENYQVSYYDYKISNLKPVFIFIKFNPLYILKYNFDYIEKFIDIFIIKNGDNKTIANSNQIKKMLLRNKKNLDIDTILNDIIYLKNYYKLTSRLAIFIYQICTFDFAASEKEIGLYFSKSLGKSKPLNKKAYNIQNVKGYDLSNIYNMPNNPANLTKIEIAKKLSNMNGIEISKDLIFEVTGISI